MIYRLGETIRFVVFYTKNGVCKTGLTVEAKVREVGGAFSSLPTVTEDGGGFYYCDCTPPNNGVYTCLFHTNGDVDQKDLGAIAYVGKGGVNNLDAAISTRASHDDIPTPEEIDTQLTGSHGAGSWQSYAVGPLVLRLSDDEIEALLEGQSRKPLSIYRGDSLSLNITVIDTNGNPVNLAGAQAIFTAKTRENLDEFIIKSELDIYDPTNGKMRLELPPEKTTIEPSSYPADIEITFPGHRVKTIWKSTLEVKWDVGR